MKAAPAEPRCESTRYEGNIHLHGICANCSSRQGGPGPFPESPRTAGGSLHQVISDVVIANYCYLKNYPTQTRFRRSWCPAHRAQMQAAAAEVGALPLCSRLAGILASWHQHPSASRAPRTIAQSFSPLQRGQRPGSAMACVFSAGLRTAAGSAHGAPPAGSHSS